jgi:restriction endonuclease S subunit
MAEARRPWRRMKLGDVLLHRKERGRPDDELLSVTSERGVIPQAEVGRRDSSSRDKSGYWRVYPGDIAYNSMRMWQGVSGRSDLLGIVSPAYTVCVPRDGSDSRFLAYLLRLPQLVREFYRFSQGLTSDTWNLKYRRFKDIPIELPPLPEQRRVAQILESVDKTIRETEMLIAKLKQVKQGLLYDLLSRGIDENGELRDPERHPERFKDSPLGRIPREWETLSLGLLLSSIDAGKSPSCPDRPAAGDEWGVLKVSAVRPDGFAPQENKALEVPGLANPAFEVRDGDFLITRANTYELVGLTCIVESPPPRLLLCDKTLRLNVSSEADAHFLLYATQMPYLRRQIEVHATGSSGSMKNISQSVVRHLKVAAPKKPEQLVISRILQGAVERFRCEEKELSKLRLLKAGLMDDLLTGRVRVTPLLEKATA